MLRQIFSNAKYLLSSQVLCKLLQIGRFIIIARVMGAEVFGEYTFEFAFGYFTFMFIEFGLTDLTIRELSKDKYHIRSFIGNVFFLKLFLLLPVLIIASVLLQFLNLSHIQKISIFLVFVILFLEICYTVLRSVFFAFNKMAYDAVIMIINNIIIFGLVILFVKLNLGLIFVFVAFLIGNLATFIIGYIATIRKFVVPLFVPDFTLMKTIFKKAIPFFITEMMILILYKITIFFLQIYHGSSSVGFYETSYALIRQVDIFPSLFVMAFYPYFSRFAYRLKNYHLYKKAFIYNFIFSLVLFCVFFFGGKFIIDILFGRAFSSSILVLKVLSLALLFISTNAINTSFLNAINLARMNVVFYGIAIIFNIILNFLLIPKLSYIGAAFATVISYAGLFLIESVYLTYHFKKIKRTIL